MHQRVAQHYNEPKLMDIFVRDNRNRYQLRLQSVGSISLVSLLLALRALLTPIVWYLYVHLRQYPVQFME